LQKSFINTQHATLVNKLCRILKKTPKDIKFCNQVQSIKSKNKKLKKSPRILVVEDEVIITFVEDTDSGVVKKSKQFASKTIEKLKMTENVVSFDATMCNDVGDLSNKIKSLKFETDDAIHLNGALQHCIDVARFKAEQQKK
jgi:hypothetical protein